MTCLRSLGGRTRIEAQIIGVDAHYIKVWPYQQQRQHLGMFLKGQCVSSASDLWNQKHWEWDPVSGLVPSPPGKSDALEAEIPLGCNATCYSRVSPTSACMRITWTLTKFKCRFWFSGLAWVSAFLTSSWWYWTCWYCWYRSSWTTLCIIKP